MTDSISKVIGFRPADDGTEKPGPQMLQGGNGEGSGPGPGPTLLPGVGRNVAAGDGRGVPNTGRMFEIGVGAGSMGFVGLVQPQPKLIISGKKAQSFGSICPARPRSCTSSHVIVPSIPFGNGGTFDNKVTTEFGPQTSQTGNIPDGDWLGVADGTEEGWTLTLGVVDGSTDKDGVPDGCTDNDGVEDGDALGALDGRTETDGLSLGVELGWTLTEGLSDGDELGVVEGCTETDGLSDGEVDGETLGVVLGSTETDGVSLGLELTDGVVDGELDGESLGCKLGSTETDGLPEGTSVGDTVTGMTLLDGVGRGVGRSEQPQPKLIMSGKKLHWSGEISPRSPAC